MCWYGWNHNQYADKLCVHNTYPVPNFVTAEREFVRQHRNWHIYRAGWPDFLCYNSTEGFVAVEVKQDGQTLPQHQYDTLSALDQSGLRSVVWTPARGAVPYHKVSITRRH